MNSRAEKRRLAGIFAIVAAGNTRGLARSAQADPDAIMAAFQSLMKDRDEALKGQRDALEAQRIDPLTKIPNRKTLETAIDIEIAHIERGDSKGCTVAFFDLIGFKQINDKQGYENGDRAICTFAQGLSAQIHRKTDMPARLGGDEFMILLTNTDPEHGRQHIEDIAKTLNSTLSLDIPNGPSISLRARHKTVNYEPGDTPETMIYRADPKGKAPVTTAAAPQSPLPTHTPAIAA